MKKSNINEWMWLIVLFTYVAYFSSLLGSGKITLFIHPKMIKYIIFTVIVFIILISQQVKKLKSLTVKKFRYSYLIFLIPIVMAIVVNPTTLSAKVVSNKGADYSNPTNYSDAVIDTTEEVTRIEANTDTNIKSSADLSKEDSMPVVSIQTESTLMEPSTSDDQYANSNYNTKDGAKFLETVDTISSNLTGMLGRETEIEGFIYLEDGFEENQFVVSRYMMSCCAADAQIIGILSYYTGDADVKADQWVKVTGYIDKTMYKSVYEEEEIEMALIKVAEIQVITAPEDMYVYPY